MNKDVSTIRKQGLDKFYTITSVAKDCIDIVGSLYTWNSWDLVIEPSAGNGSFYNQLPIDNKIGLDISPDNHNIIQQDFFSYTPEFNKDANILIIGNPPFGKSSSLAIKFFNHAASFANTIAFIIPRTFRRISVSNKLSLNFHLIYDKEIPCKPCSFEPPMMAKCCFQIWQKQNTKRNIIHLPINHDHWVFLPFGPKDEYGQPTPPIGADFALRAYGGKCGEIVTSNLSTLRPKSWHWIKSKIDTNKLIQKLNNLDYSISKNTARQNSIGKAELVFLYNTFINSKIK